MTSFKLLLTAMVLSCAQYPRLRQDLSLNFTIDYPVAYGAMGMADGDDLIYVCGGRNATVISSTCTVFSPKNCFGNKSPCRIIYSMSQPRWGMGFARAFQKLWLIGGFVLSNITSPGAASDLIESATRQRVAIGPGGKLSQARGFALVLSKSDVIYVIGGLSNCCPSNVIDVYRGTSWYQLPAVQLGLARGESCGAFLESTDGVLAFAIGGRNADSQAYDLIDIIKSDDTMGGQLKLAHARFACVAVASKSAIIVMGGIGRRLDANPAFAPLGSIEIVTGAMVVQSASLLAGGAISHQTLVEAPPFVFALGGNSLSVESSALPPSPFRPSSNINVLNRDSGILLEFGIALATARAFASASAFVDGIEHYIFVTGGFTAANTTQGAGFEIINFQLDTRAPTPVPTEISSTVSAENATRAVSILPSTSKQLTSETAATTLSTTLSPITLIGAAVGGAIALLLLIAIVVLFLFCVHQRRTQKAVPADVVKVSQYQGLPLQNGQPEQRDYDILPLKSTTGPPSDSTARGNGYTNIEVFIEGANPKVVGTQYTSL
jgi:hypothetical protein